MKPLRNTLILIGLALYAAAYCMTPLADVAGSAGKPMWRIEWILLVLLRPDDHLFPNWFGVVPQFALFDRLPILLVSAMILAWAGVLGWLVVLLFRRIGGGGGFSAMKNAADARAPALTRIETFVFSLAVGLNVVSTWVLAFGLAGMLDRAMVFVLPATATFTAAAIVVWLRRRRERDSRRLADAGLLPIEATGTARQNAPGDSTGLLSSRWLWFALPFVAMIFLAAMLPPLDFDVREYHMQAPKEFFQQGRIAFLPHNVYANMAMGTEMLSLLGMVVVGDWWLGALIGKTLIAAFTPLAALALWAAGRRLHSTTAGIVAALVYLSTPWIVSVSSAGLVEGASACYLFLAVYALILAGHDNGSGRSRAPVFCLLLAGYMAGAAVATKYPAALFVLLPLAAWTLVGRIQGSGFGVRGPGVRIQGSGVAGPDRNGMREPASGVFLNPEPRTRLPVPTPWAALVLFLLAATAGCGLWFGKNWVLTGNPTYPLLYETFDGATWTAAKDRQWNDVHRPHDFSIETLGTDVGRVLMTSPWLSPLVIPLAALAFVGAASRTLRRLAWRLLAYAAFVVAVWWLFTHRIDRFWLPVLPVLALLAGFGACWTLDVWWRRMFKTVLVVGLAATFLMSATGYGNAWFVPLDQLRGDPQWISPWHWYFNNDARRGAVLLVGDAAPFDLVPRAFYNTCFDDCLFEQIVKGKSAGAIRAELAARRIGYVLVDWGEIHRYRATYGFTDFVQPEVFDRLVDEGVLKALPPEPGHAQQAYRVVR